MSVPPRVPRRLLPGERVSRRVLLATDALDGPVAVKLARGTDPADARELGREMERLASLSHPAFPRALAFGAPSGGTAWMTLERACGDRPVGPSSRRDLARIADGLCEALSYLHARRLVHRDLKLDHVRFDAATARVMLLDLGSAAPRLVPAPPAVAAAHRAPEASGGSFADERADVFALGAVLFELACGRPPFSGSPEEILRAQREGRAALPASCEAPVAFARQVARMLAPDPASRPPTADACREALAASLESSCGERLGEPATCGREREMDDLLELAALARREGVAVALTGVTGSGRSRLLRDLRFRLMAQGFAVVTRDGRDPLGGLAREMALAADACEPAGDTLDDVLATLASLPVALLVDDADACDQAARRALLALAQRMPSGALIVACDPRGALATALTRRVDLGALSETGVGALAASALRGEASAETVEAALATSRLPKDVLASLAAQAAPRDAGRSGDAQALLRRGRIVAAAQAAQAQLGTSLAPAARARALASLGHALWAQADAAEALARTESALEMAERQEDDDAASEAACVLGRIYGSFGSTRDGVTWQRRALELAPADGASRHAALSELGLLMIREGHLDAAERTLAEALARADELADRGAAALARARLGRARALAGDLGAAQRLLRRAVEDARDSHDRLAEIAARRMLGALLCACGDEEPGLHMLHAALEAAMACAFLQELPAIHEALASASLRRAVRLRTSAGTIVDRRDMELARAHVDKGLDLALATGRMADRAALQVLGARCALLMPDAAAAQSGADEAHRLALDAGDLLVASQARLVRAEALLDIREYGEALAEARIACEAFDRSGDLEDAWRAHATLARIHGAWGMSGKQAQETDTASRILRKLQATLRTARERRAFAQDVERAAAMAPARPRDAARARRGPAPELRGARFAGRADAEDLVDALVASRRRVDELERRSRATREVVRDARARRDALLRAALLQGGKPRELARVLDLVSRACGGASVVLALVSGARLRGRGMAGRDEKPGQAALVVARRVVETGKGSVALGAVGHRRGDPPTGDVHVALPLMSPAGARGALVVRPSAGRPLRRADVRLLRALVPLLARALATASAPAQSEATALA